MNSAEKIFREAFSTLSFICMLLITVSIFLAFFTMFAFFANLAGLGGVLYLSGLCWVAGYIALKATLSYWRAVKLVD